MNELQPVKKPGVKVPKFAAVPRHIAIVMDGNGRWANQRGLTRIEGHKAGELSLNEVVAGCIEAGVEYLTVFAFSTENWKRSPEEVRFLMGFNREVIQRRRDQFNAWGVRIRWAGRRPKLWATVIEDLQEAEQLTRKNKALTLTMCINYGSRIEITDAVNEITRKIAAGELAPGKVTEKTIAAALQSNWLPDVDLFIRSSGEQRISNFLLWQSAYAEMVFEDTLWPDFDREVLWRAISQFGGRSRRFGAAIDKPKAKAKKG
ncbi:MAG: isoprenyl transferase [Micrococcales bacterium]